MHRLSAQCHVQISEFLTGPPGSGPGHYRLLEAGALQQIHPLLRHTLVERLGIQWLLHELRRSNHIDP